MTLKPVFKSPLVYLGPSLDAREALDHLPGAEIRPPIQRHDLYRDREAGYSVFVIIDGVFLQQQAVSPREIADVAQDGGFLVGASSMGAMRAAECWPLGMRGIGAIYRLFRCGALQSDDEVIQGFDPDTLKATSTALVNMRFALRRAVRTARISPQTAAGLIARAEAMFYPERSWRAILSGSVATESGGSLVEFLRSEDLKRNDAIRALSRVNRWLREQPALRTRPRTSRTRFQTSEEVREPPHDSLGTEDPNAVRRGLGRFSLVSGRYRSHLPVLQEPGSSPTAPKALTLELLRREWLRSSPPGVAEIMDSAALDHSLARRLESVRILEELFESEDAFSHRLWAELAVSGDLDAEVFRWRAFHLAVDSASERGLKVKPIDRYRAEREAAHRHGFLAWDDLAEAFGAGSRTLSILSDYLDRLALAKRWRSELFRQGPLAVASRSDQSS